jgi:selenocysteine-specific elongation factor
MPIVLPTVSFLLLVLEQSRKKSKWDYGRFRSKRRGRENKEQGTKNKEASAAAVASPLDDAALRIAALLRADGRTPRTDGEVEGATVERWRSLERAGLAVRVGANLHFHPEPLAELEERVIALARRDGEATIATVRDELATSRKYAQALLEHLDGQGITIRRGDAHVLRRKYL